jgi:hypothetical protein
MEYGAVKAWVPKKSTARVAWMPSARLWQSAASCTLTSTSLAAVTVVHSYDVLFDDRSVIEFSVTWWAVAPTSLTPRTSAR